MMSFHFLGLTEDQTFAICELREDLPFAVRETGMNVTVCAGNVNALEKRENGILLTYAKPHAFFRVLTMLPRFAEEKAQKWLENADFDMLCYMADMSRNGVYNIPAAKKMLRILALCGYDSMMLYTEDTYEIPEYPYFGYMRGRFTKDEMKEIDAYAARFGMEVIPCIQTLAHLYGILQWPAFQDVLDNGDIMLAGEEKTYELVGAMLKTCRECFRSKRINLGMDEAHMLGLGKYLDRNGYHPKPEIMLAHLSRVVAICKKYGYEPMIWSDMFFRMQFHGTYRVREGEVSEDVRRLVPPEVALVYWDYYSLDHQIFEHMVQCHQQFDNPIYFAGGISRWYGFAPFNALSMDSAKIQMSVCCEKNIRNVIVTAWGDNGSESSEFCVLPTLLYYSEWMYGKREPDSAYLDARCKEVFDLGLDDLLVLDTPNDMGGDYFKQGTLVTPCKYLLYNDLFLGLMDLNLDPKTVADACRKNVERLKAYVGHQRWGYMYETLCRLCDLLVEKSDCSVRIRRAYRTGDRETLRTIAKGEIPLMSKKLDAFIEAFRNQWYLENKTFGFEIQEMRLGGMRERWASVAERLIGYLDGKYDRIEELEQEQLPFQKGFSETNPYIKHGTTCFETTPAKINS